MSCIYKYKNKIYTESQIKDLILERDILKNHPIVTFIKKLFKTLPFQYKENLLNEGSKKYGIERGESTATIKYSLADQNKVEYGLKAIEILHSDKAIQIFEKGKKNNWSLDKILTELQIPKEQKQLILDLGITDREKIALELASKYSFVVEINTAKKEYSKNYTRGNQTPTEDRPYGNNTFEINNVEYSSNIMDGGYKKYENGKYYNITAEEYKKAFDSFEKTYETIPTSYYSNLTVPVGTNYTENEISTPLITPSIKGHAQFSTDNGIGWFRSDEQKQNTTVTIPVFRADATDGNFIIPTEKREQLEYGLGIYFGDNRDTVVNNYQHSGNNLHERTINVNNNEIFDLDNFDKDIANHVATELEKLGGIFVFLGKQFRNNPRLVFKNLENQIDGSNWVKAQNTINNALKEKGIKVIKVKPVDYEGNFYTVIDNSVLSNNQNQSNTKTRRILELQSDLFQKGRDIKSPDEIIEQLKKEGKLQIKCD